MATVAIETNQIKCVLGPEWKSKITCYVLAILTQLRRTKLVCVVFLDLC